MRGDDKICGSFFSYIDLEDRVRADHPLRPIREIANTAWAALSADFAALYSGMGRPSVPPEKLLRAMLLQAFYSVRSERQLMERVEFDLRSPRWTRGTRSTCSAPRILHSAERTVANWCLSPSKPISTCATARAPALPVPGSLWGGSVRGGPP